MPRGKDSDTQKQITSLYDAPNVFTASLLRALLQLKTLCFLSSVCYCMPVICGAYTHSPTLNVSGLPATMRNGILHYRYFPRYNVSPHQDTYFFRTSDALIRNILYVFAQWCASSSKFLSAHYNCLMLFHKSLFSTHNLLLLHDDDRMQYLPMRCFIICSSVYRISGFLCSFTKPDDMDNVSEPNK